MSRKPQSLKMADISSRSIVDTQEIMVDPSLSTQTDEDESNAASQSYRAPRYANIGNFVIPDAESATPPRHGRSSGLVNNEKIGKTVRASSPEKKPGRESPLRKRRRTSNMLKELLPHNEDVTQSTRYDNLEPLLKDIDDFKPTRSQQRFLDNKPIFPMTYDEKKLMERQLHKNRDRKVFFSSQNQTPPKRSGLTRKAKTSPQQITQTTTKVEPRKASSPKASDRIIEMQAKMNLDDWRKWDERKSKFKPRF